MKIHVSGDHPAVGALREYLKALGYAVVTGSFAPSGAFAIRVEVSSAANIAVQGPHGPLVDEALRAIAELASVQVEWFPSSGESTCTIQVSAPEIHADAIGRGLLRAVLRISQNGTAQSGWYGFLSQLWKRLSKTA
jgi:hypothetical protein